MCSLFKVKIISFIAISFAHLSMFAQSEKTEGVLNKTEKEKELESLEQEKRLDSVRVAPIIQVNAPATNNSNVILQGGIPKKSVEKKKPSPSNKVSVTPKTEVQGESVEGESVEEKSMSESTSAPKSNTQVSIISTIPNYKQQNTQRSYSKTQEIAIDKRVQELKKFDSNKNLSESLELAMLEFEQRKMDLSLLPVLSSFVSESKINSSQLVNQVLAASFILDSTSILKSNLRVWFKSDSENKSSILYASDLLKSVDLNGIMFTHAYSDSYMILYNQEILEERKDIKIIPIEFLINKEYRQKVRNFGLILPAESDSQIIDTAYFQKIIDANKAKKLFFAPTIPITYFGSNLDEFLFAGLALVNTEAVYSEPLMMEELWRNSLNKALVINQEKYNNTLAKNYLGIINVLEQFYMDQNKLKKAAEMKTYRQNIIGKFNPVR